MALVFPNTYEVGMANLGYQRIFHLLGRLPGWRCERAFCDGEKPLSLESGRALSEFDVVAFSVSFELDYLNLVSGLVQSGIAPLSEDRELPLVIAGGICTFMNPEPLRPFVDLFFVGEGEIQVPELMERISVCWGAPKERLLANLAEVAGAYVPGISSSVTRQVLPELGDEEAFSPIVTPRSHFKDMLLVEVGRGCSRGCRFCAAGFVYRPVRRRSPESLIARMDTELGDIKSVGLMGSAISDYPGLALLCAALVERGCAIATSSFRADCITPGLIRSLVSGGVRTLTIAPETGSEQLRMRIGKKLSDQAILEAARCAAEGGIPNLRVYFMFGLPFEEAEDVAAIPEFVSQIRGQFLAGGGRRVTVSAHPFVPKAGTPFQWCPMDVSGVLKAKYRIIRTGLASLSGVTLLKTSVRMALLQGLLAMGDEKVGMGLLYRVSEGLPWKRAWEQAGVDPSTYLHRFKAEQETLPWDTIVHKTSRETLWREYRRAAEEGGRI
ncbi:MAG: radical SAM protein [Candidatus Latescibacterota bacterium]